MPNVHIKDVPAETLAVWHRRAAAANQSLQRYLRSWLIHEASQSTADEVLDRTGGRTGGSLSFADAVTALHGDRARR